MNKKLVAFLVVAALLSVVVIGGKALPKGAVTAQETDLTHTITVSGVGTATVTPDIAIINAGVFVEDLDPAKAMDGLSQKANKIVEAVTNSGVKKEDIKTSNLSLYPIYSYEKDTGKPILQGYRASESFTVKEKISDAGTIISAVSKAGANQIDGITFDASNRDSLKLDAIDAAMKDARAKADAALKGTNYKVTGIKTISVESSTPTPIYFKAMASEQANVPVEGGTIDVNATVQVIFTFD
ncbi:MAG: SIMPL domain-containing protein [Caldisericaceae bacterium]